LFFRIVFIETKDVCRTNCGQFQEYRALLPLTHFQSKIEKIHKAVKDGDIETVRQLMTSKKLALARDKHGLTPLHCAIVNEQSEIIRFIASKFPSVLNAPDYNKRSPMHFAAASRDGGHYLKILAKAGADPTLTDNEGRTPDYYKRNAVFDLKLLKERDEDVDVYQENLQDKLVHDDIPQSPELASIIRYCIFLNKKIN
jgi:nucleolar GTP-binding protein